MYICVDFPMGKEKSCNQKSILAPSHIFHFLFVNNELIVNKNFFNLSFPYVVKLVKKKFLKILYQILREVKDYWSLLIVM